MSRALCLNLLPALRSSWRWRRALRTAQTLQGKRKSTVMKSPSHVGPSLTLQSDPWFIYPERKLTSSNAQSLSPLHPSSKWDLHRNGWTLHLLPWRKTITHLKRNSFPPTDSRETLFFLPDRVRKTCYEQISWPMSRNENHYWICCPWSF